MLTKTLYRATIILIILFFLLKPFFLGFYHDDWSTIVGTVVKGSPFSLDLLSSSIQVLLSRPVSGLVLFSFASIAGKSPLIWQFLTSLLVLLGIYVFSKFLSSLVKSLKLETSWEETAAFAALFFALPWMAGATFFVVAAICALTATLFFLLSGISLLNYINTKKTKWLIGVGAFYLLSILTYEAFYLQFILLTLLGTIVLKAKKEKISNLVLVFIVLAVAQLLGIAWNRFTFSLAPASKSINPDFLPLFLYTLRVIPERFLFNFKEIYSWAFLSLIAYILYTLVILKSLFRKSFPLGVSTLSFICLAILGICLSVFLYALAGYGVDAHGLTSRTTLVISFYIILAVFVIQVSSRSINSDVKIFYNLTFWLVVLAIFTSLIWRFRDWKVSWREQTSVISSFPKENFKNAPKDTVIIYKGPFEYNGLTVFQSSWDLASAINYSYPGLNLTVLPSPDVWAINWDGKNLTQIAKGNKSTLWSGETKNVWLWNYPNKNVTKLNKKYAE